MIVRFLFVWFLFVGFLFVEFIFFKFCLSGSFEKLNNYLSLSQLKGQSKYSLKNMLLYTNLETISDI